MKTHNSLPGRLLAWAMAAGLTTFLAGCGGGGSTTSSSGSTDVTVSGTVKAPSGTTVASAARTQWLAWLIGTEAYALGGTTPVPNANVFVYRFSDGQLLGQGTTDSAGKYSIDIPNGVDVLIVAQKGTVRLSKVLADVSTNNDTADLDAATTLAAESFGATHYRKNSNISTADITPLEQTTATALAAVTDLDLSTSGGVLSAEFGGGIQAPQGATAAVTQLIQTIQQHVPTGLTGNVAKGKQMVQALRDAGTSLGNAFESEFTTQQKIIEDEVVPAFDTVGQHLGFVGRILFDELYIQSKSRSRSMSYSIIDLPAGVYQEVNSTIPWHSMWELQQVSTTPTGNTVTITAATTDNDSKGMKLVVTRTGTFGPDTAATLTFQVTSTQDASLDYHGTATTTVTGDAVTQAALTASFVDSQITTPITVNGTLSGTPVSKQTDPSYTQLAFTGTVNTAKVKADVGTWTAKFSGSVPNGAAQDAFWAEYPTSFTIKDSSIETQNTTKTLKLTGDLDITFTTVQGAASIDTVPTKFSFTGTYAGDTVSSFVGTLGGTWNNPSLSLTTLPSATATATGTVKTSGQPDTAVELTLTTTTSNTATLDIEITRGTISLTGQATGTVDSNGDLTQAALTLTNEDGLVITVTSTDGGQTVTGTIKAADGSAVATIAVDPDLGTVKITYSDNSFETL